MTTELLLTIIAGISILCLLIERQTAWFVHINGACLTIVVALLLSAIGVVPNKHPLYDFFSKETVPIAIALLIMSLNMKDVLRLPSKFLLVFSIGIAASVCGALAAAYVGSIDLGTDAAKLAAQLGASYIGGGENAVAMQKIFNIPNELFVGAFAVDNVLISFWMFIAIAYAGRRFGSENERDESDVKTQAAPHIVHILSILFLGMLIVQVSRFLATAVGILHPLLYNSIISLLVGQIPLVRKHLSFSYPMGSLIFFPFFFSIGALSDFAALTHLSRAVIWMPMIVVGLHGLILVTFAVFFGVPRHYAAVASQALIGGPSTAIAVAQAKNWKGGVAIALIAGVFGYAIANFFGVLIHYIGVKIISV